MLQDLRFALRQLRRTPGFALITILTFGLGLGANAAVFSVMNAVVLRFLPVQEPDRLVFLHTSRQPDGASQTGFDDTSLSYQAYQELRAERKAFSELMAYVPLGSGQVAARVGNEPETVWADMVSGNFFSGLGIPMARGRGVVADDEATHAPHAVISYAYWTRRFARRPDAVGSTLFVKGVPFTIVGITGPSFVGLGRGRSTDVWIPIQSRAELKPWGRSPDSEETFHTSPNWWFLLTVGRLAPGVSMEQALAIAQPAFRRAAYAPLGGAPRQGETPAQLSFSSARGMMGLRDQYRQPLRVLMAMVALVLLIACGNIAMLLAARNSARLREFSLRTALGGSSGRLLRQLLVESALLVTAGTALGWAIALAATRALAVLSDLEVTIAPDATVFAYALGLALLATLVFGLAPLQTARGASLALVLRSSALNATADRGKVRGTRIVLAGQIALCVALLVGAGLLVRTLQNLNGANLGLRTSGLFVFGVTAPASVTSDTAVVQFYQSLIARIRTLPGVESATLMGNRIGSGWSNNTIAIVDGARPTGAERRMRWNNVGPDFFRVLGTPMLLGRDFTEADLTGPPTVIVNDAFVRAYSPNRPAIGHTVALSSQPGSRQYTIIGIAANSSYTGVRESMQPMAYFLYAHVPAPAELHIEVRATGDPSRLAPDIRRIVASLGPDLPLIRPMTQQAQFAESYSDERLFSRLAAAFGLLAAVLVAIGLYGTLAYRVARRTSEIGIRVALGARRAHVVWMVVRDSLGVCLAGMLLGVPLAIAGSRFLESMLFGLTTSDPWSYAGALGLVTLLAITASLVPARRAVSVDPMIALRSE
jgi:predicted permease